ncbi:MAG: hypothetical protein QGI84_08795, partial [Dehalococcoidia bacterium]|nr:hypothetical protein [Dehalococcoidia bacterium]
MFRPTRRRVATAFAVIVAVLGVLILGASWYYSGLIEEGAFKIDREADELNLEIVSLTDDQISFKHPSGEGRWE